MVFVNYKYGGFRAEIKRLLRKRLLLKDKIRYHTKKIDELNNSLPEIETQINKLLEYAKGKTLK